jgi:endonuclease/exonuclease/phosphatase family metal-dependent hydrolase
MDSNNQRLIAELDRFTTFDQLRRSAFYRKNEARIRQLIDEPRIHTSQDARPRLRSFLRVVEWNIERGARLEGIIDVLRNHPVLRFADLLLINELDSGMARSANRNVAAELSRSLSAHAIFGVEYLELTKGVGDELLIEEENTDALHGNAVLTRYPFSNPHVIRLPRCEDNFGSAEKRLGGRIGITVDIEVAGREIHAAVTHLDVTGTPQCRARQLRAFLESIFGSRAHSLRHRLLHPERREPAIGELKRFGYEVESFNDRRPTAWSIVSRLEDARRLPFPLREWVSRKIGPDGLMLEFKLDWLAARGLRALREGQARDEATGIVSLSPQTIRGLTRNGSHLSDHDPVVADIEIQ